MVLLSFLLLLLLLRGGLQEGGAGPSHARLLLLFCSHVRSAVSQDNVIVLGATHRYLKKYVTTVIYKPLQFE